jgi:hypothetical protein
MSITDRINNVFDSSLAVGLTAIIMLTAVGGLLAFSGIDVLPANLQSNLCGVSADQVRIASNEEGIAGKSWVISAVGGDCGDDIIQGGALIEKEDLQGEDPETGQQAEARRDFQIGMTDFRGWAHTDVTNTRLTGIQEIEQYSDVEGEPIYGTGLDNTLTEADRQKCEDWQDANDYAVAANNLDFPKSFFSRDDWRPYVDDREVWQAPRLYCFRTTSTAAEAYRISGGLSTDYEATFKMNAGGSTASKTVTKSEARGGVTFNAGQYSAHMTSPGALLGDVIDYGFDSSDWVAICDDDCSEPNNQIDWKIVGTNPDLGGRRSTPYNSYIDLRDNMADTLQNEIGSGSPGIEASLLNSYADQMTNNEKNLLVDSSQFTEEVEFVGNELRLYTNDRTDLLRPEFTFTIDADWVGFFVPVAQPEIQASTLQDIQMEAKGDTTVNFDVRNNAEVSGDVHASLRCDSASLYGGSQDKNIRAGGTASYSINLQAASTPDITSSCTVSVKDKDSREAVQDQASFNVDVAASCTHSDSDGVCDDIDACPTEPGPDTTANGNGRGCPNPGGPGRQDSDNDGVYDVDDECPGTPPNVEVNQEGCQVDGPGTKPEDEYVNGCSDGVDNDGDDLIDERDPDCESEQGIPTIAYIISGLAILGIIGYLVVPRSTLQSIRQRIKRRVGI